MKSGVKTYIYHFFGKDYKPVYILKDMLAGIIIALISIPISMGYSQIAGLPMIYGLYGSLLPILIYGLITTSKDFVFGVDAAPAALTGGVIAAMGIASESEEAIKTVPVITLAVSIWLLLFYILKAGRAVKYISMPVMGGFITGICIEIISIQIPKLYGGTAGTGEFYELVLHIIEEFKVFSPVSFGLSILCIAIILISRKFIPKFPMSIIILVAGGILTLTTNITDYGVKLLPDVAPGLPHLKLIHINVGNFSEILFSSLTIALVIMCETLLASRQNAINDGYDLNPSREVLAYTMANLSSAIVGSCPVNASVSRTSIARQFGSRSQLTSIFASITMAVILIFCTGFIKYLPVPVLTAIVVSALYSACEFHLAHRLLKTSKRDFIIFISVALGVLIFGTIYGVVIGCILSFFTVIVDTIVPPKDFMGVIEGRDGYYSLRRNKYAKPIDGVIIYRYGGNLCFANIDTFVKDIQDSIKPDTKVVIVYGSGIGNIDITATDRLVQLNKTLKERGISFYLTEHDGSINDKLKRFGASELIDTGVVRRTVDNALRDARIDVPTYNPLNGTSKATGNRSASRDQTTPAAFLSGLGTELEWAHGADADKVKRELAQDIMNKLLNSSELNTEHDIVHLERFNPWGRLAYMDEDEILDIIETHLPDIADATDEEREHLTKLIDERRRVIESRISDRDPDSLKELVERRREYHTANKNETDR